VRETEKVVEHHRHDAPWGEVADYVRDPEPTEPGPVMVNNDDTSLHFISEIWRPRLFRFVLE